MSISEKDRTEGIRKKLKALGLNDPLWLREIALLIRKDIKEIMEEGIAYEEAEDMVFDRINTSKMVTLKFNHPINNWHLIYRSLVWLFAGIAVLMVLAALFLIITGQPLGFLMLLSSAGVYAFMVVPFRMLYRIRRNRIDRIYQLLFAEDIFEEQVN
jgi:hypothetical protein